MTSQLAPGLEGGKERGERVREREREKGEGVGERCEKKGRIMMCE